ncbi:MAG: PLP-dependent transferase, partial [Burkholderiales bacterium]
MSPTPETPTERPATDLQITPQVTPQATQLVSAGRHFDRPIATVNLPLTRASSVLFETLALAEAEGTAAMAGEVHRTTYATSGTPTTMALMDALAEVEGAPHRCRAAIMPSGLAAISV